MTGTKESKTITDKKSLFWWCGQMPVQTGLKKDAISLVGRSRSIALSALGWEEFAEHVLRHLERGVR